MSRKIETITHKIIEISFYALFFLTPLLWNPANSELFELTKMFFVWALTIIIAGAWAVRCITNGRLIFRRTLLDIPLLIFLVTQLLSYFFSIDRHTSLWGYYTRFNGGILSLTSYALLYWAFVSNMDFKKSLHSTFYILLSTFIVALYAIPAHFGSDPTCFILGRGLNANCWSSQFVPTERIFGTLGQPNWLAAYLVALVPLAAAFALISKVKAKNSNFYALNFSFALYTLSFALLLLAIAFTRSQSGFIGLGIAAAVFSLGYFAFIRGWHLNKLTLVTTGGLLLIVLALVVPRIPAVDRCLRTLSTNYVLHSTDITPSSDIRCIVWKGAIDIWKHYPILGSGPETFAFTYYNFKPPEHSLTSEWDLLYNKAHNEFLNYAANTGTVGLASYLLLIAASIGLMANSLWLKNNKEKELSEPYAIKLALLAGYISILVTNFFGFSVVPVQLLFFLFPALAITLAQRESAINPTSHFKIHIPTSHFSLLLILLTTYYLLLTTFRFYLADINYAKAERLNSNGQYLEALTHIRLAIEKNPTEPVYRDELADIASSLAFLTVDQDSTVSAQLASIAEDASDKALAISPRSINFLRSRSNSFITLAQIDLPDRQAGPGYFKKAKDALETAQELAPTDARITYNLGLLYFQNDELEKAKGQLEKALSLRPNYEDAKIALAELKNTNP